MFYFIFFLFFTSLPVEAKILGESLAVNPYAIPGDSEMNHLALPGVRFHESNDYFGETDKLVSGVGSLSVMEVWKNYSTSFSLKGRFIQPILQTRNDQPLLTEKIGVYADSLETFWNNSITLYSRNSIGWKFNFGFGYTDVGNHGLVNLYRQIHEIVNSPIQDKLFGKKLNQNFMTSSFGLNVIFPIMDRVNFLIGSSVYNSPMLYENSYETSLIVSPAKTFAISMKYMYIDQKRSEWWYLKPDRQQFILAIRAFSVWTPSLMFVSSYVKKDDYGQFYLSPISFTFPF